MSDFELSPSKCRDLRKAIQETAEYISSLGNQTRSLNAEKKKNEMELLAINKEIFALEKKIAILLASTVASRGAAGSTAGITIGQAQFQITVLEIKKTNLTAEIDKRKHQIQRKEDAKKRSEANLSRFSAEAKNLNCVI